MKSSRLRIQTAWTCWRLSTQIWGRISFVLVVLLLTLSHSIAMAWTATQMRKAQRKDSVTPTWVGNMVSTAAVGWSSNQSPAFGNGAGHFNSPDDVAIDTTNGFFYVADTQNHRIQKFNLSTGAAIGWIGKIATTGGTCTAGVGLFTGGWCAGGTSESGSGNGMFNWPRRIALDVTGNALYVADAFNYRVQKFTLSTGAFVGWIGSIATTGGTCTAGVGLFTGGWCSGGTSQSGADNGEMGTVNGVALDVAGNLLYVVSGGRVQKFTLSTGAFISWLGGISVVGGTCTAGVGKFTGGWCSGGQGEYSNWNPYATVDGVFWGSGGAGLALDVANNALFVIDSIYRVQKFNLTTGAHIGWLGKIGIVGGTCTAGVGLFTGGWCKGGGAASGSGDGMFTAPTGIAVDPANNALLVGNNLGEIHKFNASTGAFVGKIGLIYVTGGTCTAGAGVASNSWCVGGLITSGSGDGMFNGPSGMFIDSANGLLYVAETGNNRVQKINLSAGSFIASLGANIAAKSPWGTGIGTTNRGDKDGQLGSPIGIAVDSTNNAFLIVDTNNHRIQKFNLTTGAFIGWIGRIGVGGGTCTAGVGNFTGGWCSGGTASAGTGDGMLDYPGGLALSSSLNTLYVADSGNDRVQKYNLSTGAFQGWIGRIGTGGGTCTAGVGNFTGGWCSGGTANYGSGIDGAMNWPNSVAIDPVYGSLFVADGSNNRIQKFNLSTGAFQGWIGKILTTGGSCTAGVGNFTGGWCSGGASDWGTDGDGKMADPYDVLVDTTYFVLYVVELSNHRVQKFNLRTGAFMGWIGKIGTTGGTCTNGVGSFTGRFCSGGTSDSGNGEGMLNMPYGAAIDLTKNILYISDTGNHRIMKYTSP